MRFTLLTAVLLPALSLASPQPDQPCPDPTGHPIGMPTSLPAEPAKTPTHFGLLLFPAFQALDVFGPMDILNLLSWNLSPDHNITLSIISRDYSAVTTRSEMHKEKFSQSIVPTHTFDNAPPLDVLLVPGGMGTRAPDLSAETAFIAERFPELQYLITVCTGAALAADAGVLKGEVATTNKNSWKWVTERESARETEWVKKARWVEGKGGKIWTTSGVSAGIDGVFAWVEKVWGKEMAEGIAKGMEYVRRTDAGDDPFAVEE